MYTQMLGPHSSLSHFKLHTMTHSLSHDMNAPIGNQERKSFWHFSKLPTGLISHPLYETINSSEEQEKKGDMDTLILTDNNEFPTVSTNTHIPPHSIPQPPRCYCVPHNYSHSKTTPHCRRVNSSASHGEQQQDSREQKMRRLRGSKLSWRCLSETLDNQQQAAV